jgi:predicted nucleic acid-binding protein
VILADTSVWVDHFRTGVDDLRKALLNRQIVMHPYVVAELALGSLPRRKTTIQYLEHLPSLRVAHLDEVRQMVEARALYSRGIGLIDAHLIAALYINPSTQLWTRDMRLSDIARALGMHANLR